jgi:hypothetical protein
MMTLASVPAWILGATAALSLGAAVLVPASARLPLLAIAGGAATVLASRRRAGAPVSRVRLLSRVSITPKAHAALLSVDGAGWLVVIGDGCAQLARAELAPHGEEP